MFLAIVQRPRHVSLVFVLNINKHQKYHKNTLGAFQETLPSCTLIKTAMVGDDLS